MPAARLLIWLVAISTLALVLADARPAIARVGRETVIQKRLRLERAALKNIKDTSGAVKQAARNMEQARRQLNEARRKATGAHDQFVKLQRVNDRATHDDTTQAQYERRLLSQRAVTLACLFGFTFMNGLARRSLSSAGPSMVAEGVIGYPYIEHVFLVGFEVFAVGKMLAGFVLLLLGNVRALLMQVALMAAACAWYVIEPRSAQMHAWILFRVVSGMASTTMLPFVGAWFPRKWYGRVFALLFAGFQAGYLVCSYYWGHLLARGKLHWTVPLVQSGAGFALLFAACLLWLRERPPPPPSRSAAAAATTRHGAGTGTAVVQPGTLPTAAAGTPSAAGTPPPHAPPAKLALRALFYKLATRWVFWAMLLACAAYSPAVEYSTHVTSYLKEMQSRVGLGAAAQGVSAGISAGVGVGGGGGGPADGGFVCLQSALCEGRYRGYVWCLVAGLLGGSIIYDRATQLDRAFLVVGLLLINTCCWLALALAEPDAPAPAWMKAVVQSAGPRALVRARAWAARLLLKPRAVPASAALKGAVPILEISAPFKTAITALAGATIALPSSLPFAIFALDFGKEGAAVLSSILQVVGNLAALLFLRRFPAILRKRGWFGVHAILAALGVVACVAMGAIMFKDSQKFSRGYVIRSSLLNQTVVHLHACTRPECITTPMWRPGQRRAWGPTAGRPRGVSSLFPYAPYGICHRCGKGDSLVECSVDEAATAAAVQTPFDECGEWVRFERPLRMPKHGWEFANDPTQFELYRGEAPETINAL